MNRYKIIIKFRNGVVLDFELDSEENIRQALSDSWLKPEGVLTIADYLIAASEILYIKVEGEKLG